MDRFASLLRSRNYEERVRTHFKTHTHTNSHTYTHTHTFTHTYHSHTRTHIHTHTHTFAHTRTHTHTHTHTHTQYQRERERERERVGVWHVVEILNHSSTYAHVCAWSSRIHSIAIACSTTTKVPSLFLSLFSTLNLHLSISISLSRAPRSVELSECALVLLMQNK